MVSPLEQILLLLMMIVIMFGMGASLTLRDFRRALRRPQAILIGMTSQFLLMPLIAWGLAVLLNIPPMLAIGLILMGCIPGGTTSNMFTYFAKGDLALSIIMTVCSTIVAVVMTPLLLVAYASSFAGKELQISAANVFITLLVILVPVFLAMIVRKRNANIAATAELLGGATGIIVILFLIISWVPRNGHLLATTGWPVYAAAIGLGCCGFFFGYWMAQLLKLGEQRSRTVALETGIQNGPLAITIILLTFPEAVANQVLVVPVLYSLFIVMTAAIVTTTFRRAAIRRELAAPQVT